MQRKISQSGRPSGTDGFDFSYRMVVDSRYTMVAHGKSRLSALLLFQAFILFARILFVYSKDNAFAISSTAIYFISLAAGELGRRRSRVTLLKIYWVASTFAILLWTFSVVRDSHSLKVLREWGSNKLDFLGFGVLLIGTLVQINAITTTISLVYNMSPKKAS